MPIECITFDLDDTLWECESVIERAETLFYEWLSGRHPAVTARHTAQSLVRHRRKFFARFPDEHHDLTTLRKRWLADLAATHGCPEDLVETGFRVFWEHRNAVTLFDDALDALGVLRKRYAIGAITNGNADVHHIGIGHCFDFVVTSASAGASKPAPTIFQAALDAAGVAAERAVHVGDDPARDVIGARRVGMRAVWFNSRGVAWPDGEDPPEATIASLSELDAAIETLSAPR